MEFIVMGLLYVVSGYIGATIAWPDLKGRGVSGFIKRILAGALFGWFLFVGAVFGRLIGVLIGFLIGTIQTISLADLVHSRTQRERLYNVLEAKRGMICYGPKTEQFYILKQGIVGDDEFQKLETVKKFCGETEVIIFTTADQISQFLKQLLEEREG